MDWSDTTKLEIINYAGKITTSRKAQQYLRLCLARIEVLERANASFGESFERFADQLPDMLQNELERIREAKPLAVTAPDELEPPRYDIIEKGGKQPSNPPPPPAISPETPKIGGYSSSSRRAEDLDPPHHL